MPQLHNVPNKTWVKIMPDPEEGTKVPPSAPSLPDGEVIFFDHIDGMYSYCKKQDGTVCHLVAWQPVEVVDDPR